MHLDQSLPGGTFSIISSWFLLHLVAPFLILSLTFCLNGSGSGSGSIYSLNCGSTSSSSGEFLSMGPNANIPQYTASAMISLGAGTRTHHMHMHTLHESIPCIIKCMQRAALATLISPLSLCKTFETIPQVKLIFNRLRFFVAFRANAANEELSLLKHKVACGDAIRTSGYDVHFPSIDNDVDDNVQQVKKVTNGRGTGMYRGKNKSASTCTGTIKQKAMIFIPGLLVDHTSYSTIASRIASEGNVIVVVMSLEPLRMAGEHSLELKDVKQVIRSVTKVWKRRCKGKGDNNSISSSSNDEVELEWSLSGHSFGGYGAMRLAPAFVDDQRQQQQRQQRRREQRQNGKEMHMNINEKQTQQDENNIKVVVWGAGSFPNYVTDLSDRGDDIDVLIVLGSNDNICKFETKNDLRSFQSKLPLPSSSSNNGHKYGGIKFIKGGTHNQFANYPGLEVVNGYPGITREKQYDQVVKATLDFLHQ